MGIQRITEYIRQYRHAYTREAIDGRLLDAGDTQDDITSAWNALEIAEARPDATAKPQPAPPQVQASPSTRGGDTHALPEDKPKQLINSPIFWSVLVGFIVLSVLSYWSPFFFLSKSRNIDGLISIGNVGHDYIYPGLVAGPVVQLIAIVSWRIALRKNRPVAIALLIGVLVTVVQLPFCALLNLALILVGDHPYGFG